MLLAAAERALFPSIIELQCFAFFPFTLTFPSQQESSNHNLNSLILVELPASKFNVESGGSYRINNGIARLRMIININQLQGDEFEASKSNVAEDHMASIKKIARHQMIINVNQLQGDDSTELLSTCAGWRLQVSNESIEMHASGSKNHCYQKREKKDWLSDEPLSLATYKPRVRRITVAKIVA